MKATQQPLAGIVLLPLLCFTLFVCLPSACQAQQLTWEAFLESLADERTELSETQEASWDAFLEEIVGAAVMPRIPKLPEDFQIDPAIERFSGIMPEPTKEQLEADDRLAYILGKGMHR